MWTLKPSMYSFVFSSVPGNGSCKNTCLNLDLAEHARKQRAQPAPTST